MPYLHRPPFPKQLIPLCVFIGLLGGVTAVLAAYNLREALWLRPLLEASSIVYKKEAPISREQLADTLRLYASAEGRLYSSRYGADYAALLIAAAERHGYTSLPGLSALQEAERILVTSLKASPANTFALSRLAHVRTALYGAGRAPLDAWILSLQTAPFEPKLLQWRVEFAATQSGALTPEQHAHLMQQIDYSMQVQPSATLQTLARLNRYDLVEPYLGRLPAAERAPLDRGFTYFRSLETQRK